MKWCRTSVLAILLLLVAYCAPKTYTRTSKPRRYLAVSIWSTSREGGRDPEQVRFYCRNNFLSNIRGLNFATSTHRRLNLPPGCDYIRFQVIAIGDALGAEQWTTEAFYVQPGDSLEIRISPILGATYFMIHH